MVTAPFKECASSTNTVKEPNYVNPALQVALQHNAWQQRARTSRLLTVCSCTLLYDVPHINPLSPLWKVRIAAAAATAAVEHVRRDLW
jgi:hypothetical protein